MKELFEMKREGFTLLFTHMTDGMLKPKGIMLDSESQNIYIRESCFCDYIVKDKNLKIIDLENFILNQVRVEAKKELYAYMKKKNIEESTIGEFKEKPMLLNYVQFEKLFYGELELKWDYLGECTYNFLTHELKTNSKSKSFLEMVFVI